jgi:DNA-binding NarL/FixJ family response regulator
MRCVFVDDDPIFLRAARVLLERQGIDVVAVASTGAEARRFSRELLPEVVLVDVALHGESGFDLAHQLTAEGGNGDPKIILISNYSADDFRDLIADSPALSFLSKTDLSGDAIRSILPLAGDR